MNSRRNSLCGAIVAAAAALALLAPAASAQDWPKGKPIQFVVGFGPGSTTDLVARFIAPKLSEALGQTVVVENRPGAGGNIAVTSATRSAALPDVPTVNEQGFKDFDDLTWIGFFAPAGTPANVVSRINGEINRIVELPDVKDRLAQNGLTSQRNSPAEFAAFVRAEIPKFAKAVKDSGAKVD